MKNRTLPNTLKCLISVSIIKKKEKNCLAGNEIYTTQNSIYSWSIL